MALLLMSEAVLTTTPASSSACACFPFSSMFFKRVASYDKIRSYMRRDRASNPQISSSSWLVLLTWREDHMITYPRNKYVVPKKFCN